uniref:N-acetyltransferase domain-containing protein n=1 Tax=Panagrellus redivivus TaxID=6233 RepID=A0A7E4ZWZ1_PANRE
MFRRAITSVNTMATRFVGHTRVQVAKPANIVRQSPFLTDDGMFYDMNPLSRPIVRKGWASPVSGTIVDFVKAEARDAELVTQFWLEGFRESSNVCVHLGLTYDELHEMLSNWVTEMLDTGDVILGFDGTKLACLQLMRYHYEHEYEELFAGELPGHPNPKFIIKDDYAQDITSYPLPRNSARLACFLDDLVRQTGKFLPADVKSYCVFEATYVHKTYQKDRMGSVLINLAVEATLRRNVIHGVGYCVAMGTRKIALAQQWTPLFDALYKDYKDNGKPVFYDMHDGAMGSLQTYKKLV